jgi:hypothetical protein
MNQVHKPNRNLMIGCELKTLDPGLRRDDYFEVNGLSNVIPAQAGIQCLSSCFS